MVERRRHGATYHWGRQVHPPIGEPSGRDHRANGSGWVDASTIGREYVERRMSNGDTKTEALRLLRRRLSDEVFRRLLDDEAVQTAGSSDVFLVAA